MSRRIRSKEADIQIIVNGSRLGKSMRKVTDFRLEPTAEFTRTPFVGQARDSNDINITGYEFSFTTHVNDFEWWDIWQDIADREELGAELPTITLTVTYKLRGTSNRTVVLSDDLLLKLDTSEIPEGDYVNNTWSGVCQTAQGF